MTRTEAFDLSKLEGTKIAHRFFQYNEWMIVYPNNIIIFEDGFNSTVEIFNLTRNNSQWLTDWSVYEEI